MGIESGIINAIRNRDFDKAKSLIDSGEKIDKEVLEQPNFELPLEQLITARQFDIINAMIEDKLIETDIYEYDSFNRSIFQKLFRSLPADEESLTFFKDFVGRLQNINDNIEDTTLLGYALEEGAKIEIVKCLIEAGCDVNYLNDSDSSFLYQVVSKRMLDPEKAMAYLEVLIAEGIDVNKANAAGETPLIIAVKNNKHQFLDLLLTSGADPELQDNEGNTAFYYAVAGLKSKIIFDKLITYASPDFELTNRADETFFLAYMRMLYNNNDINLLPELLDAGAELRMTSRYYDKQKSGYDWLAEKSFETLEVAMSTGKVDVNEQDEKGETLLHKVCAFDINLDDRIAKDIYKKTKLLIEAGADVNLLTNKDESVLMLASNNNKKAKTVQLLLDASAK